jgi:large repetitive protein
MITVTVNALPSVVANTSASAVCFGNPVTLTGSGADTYTWTGNVTDNVPFTPSTTDTYTVTGTDVNGCVNTASVMVTVNALPVVIANTSDSTVCAGSPVTLSGSGADVYSWTGNVSDNVPFNPTTTDTYTVTGTDSLGCANTASITIFVHMLPTVTVSLAVDTLCTNDAAVTLSGASPAGGTWSGTAVTGSSFNPGTAGLGTTVITYSYTDAFGCSASSTDNIVVDACVGVAENEVLSAVNVYPNPAQNSLTISANISGSPVQLSLVNVLGERVLVIDNQASGAYVKTIDLSSLPAGVYFVQLTQENSILANKMIIKQ